MVSRVCFLSGVYTLNTRSDDGSILWVDGAEVVNNDGLHGPRTRSGRIRLSAGWHRVRIAFFENGYVLQQLHFLLVCVCVLISVCVQRRCLLDREYSGAAIPALGPASHLRESIGVMQIGVFCQVDCFGVFININIR